MVESGDLWGMWTKKRGGSAEARKVIQMGQGMDNRLGGRKHWLGLGKLVH